MASSPSIALADYVATFRSVELPCPSWEAGFQMLVSLLYRMVLQNGPGAVKGAPPCAAKRTLYGEDRSERIAKEGNEAFDF